MMEPALALLCFAAVTLGTIGGPYLLIMAWHWRKKRRATRRRHLQLRRMADLEDRCESVSVGGLAVKLGMLRPAGSAATRDGLKGQTMNAGNAEMTMPLYQCHKRVRAVKIAEINSDVDIDLVRITPEGHPGEHVFANRDYVEKHRPEVGGYYVRYEDGYESYSPPGAFEGGYSPIGDLLGECKIRGGGLKPVSDSPRPNVVPTPQHAPPTSNAVRAET